MKVEVKSWFTCSMIRGRGAMEFINFGLEFLHLVELNGQGKGANTGNK